MKQSHCPTTFRTGALAAWLFSTACGGASLHAPAAPTLPPEVGARGAPIYVGTVFPLAGGSGAPSFSYTRSVEAKDGALISTHVTRDAAGGVALAESALHDSGYKLSEYTLYANQLGQTGSIRVEGTRVYFRVHEHGEARTAVEQQSDPVVVGPTLIGYMVQNLDALAAGEPRVVRMAVLDRLETIGFALSTVPGDVGQTRVRMKPTSFLIGLAVDPIDFSFETASKKLVRLEGRVPPKVWASGGWRDFDARVEYQFVADRYL